MSVKIGHVSVDTTGSPTGGSLGSFSSDTIFIRGFYEKDWHTVYRISEAKAEIVASTMEAICANDNIEYGESGYMDFYNAAKQNKWDVSKIEGTYQTDSVMVIMVIVRAIGEVLGNAENVRFHNLDYILTSCGFKAMQYKTKDTLKRGDIILGDTHVAVVLSDGDKVDRRSAKDAYIDTHGLNKSYIGKEIATAITTRPLDVYSGPNTFNYNPYKVLPKNSKIAILEVNENGWIKIVYPYVQAGYGYIDSNKGKFIAPDNNK